ncbi:MAG: M28 family peptidase [Candidatus Marinimicrobia bacterium]|nr:M28 family peptidase [Candidatus Neomarinimicrobiota bacterium]
MNYIYCTMKGKQILEKFSNLPRRGTTTKEEKSAAQFLKNVLKEMGIKGSFDSFKAISSYSWEVILFSLFMMAGILMSPWLSFLGTAFVLIGFLSFFRHFMGRSTPFRPFIPKRTSQNIIGRIPPKYSVSKRNLILMAHYDSERASMIFSPSMVKSFRENFVFNTIVSAVTIPWAFLGQYWADFWWFKLICVLLALNQIVNIFIHIHRELAHKFVPGINDNGSGVAAIFEILNDLKKHPLQNTDLWIVFTGCEGAGIQGVKHFIDNYKSDLNPGNTYVINIDNVGKGNLHYVTGEGMLLFWKYNEIFIDKCAVITSRDEFLKIQPLEYRCAYFDALVFAQQGYPCTTLIALDDDGNIPNWRWYTDTIENIDYETIQLAVDFSLELIRQIETS